MLDLPRFLFLRVSLDGVDDEPHEDVDRQYLGEGGGALQLDQDYRVGSEGGGAEGLHLPSSLQTLTPDTETCTLKAKK